MRRVVRRRRGLEAALEGGGEVVARRRPAPVFRPVPVFRTVFWTPLAELRGSLFWTACMAAASWELSRATAPTGFDGDDEGDEGDDDDARDDDDDDTKGDARKWYMMVRRLLRRLKDIESRCRV